MHTVASVPARSQSPALWLLAGKLEPTQLVDDARGAMLDDSGGIVDPRASFGVRRNAAYRRFGAEGGRSALTADNLECARVGLDKHRGAQWRRCDVDTIDEIRHRSATAADFGARANNEIPEWWRCEGSDGDRIVPRRFQPFMAIVWWAFATGRFGVLASTVELGAELGVDPRTIRAWRAACVRLGLLRRGTHRYIGADGCEHTGPQRNAPRGTHCEPDRTWRPGKHKRPCDRARNLYRIGPVLEAFAGDAVGQGDPRVPKGKGKAQAAARATRKAAGALRRAGRLAAYRRTGEVWDRETARVRGPSTTPAPRGPKPVSAERMERTRLHDRVPIARSAEDRRPPRPTRAAPRSVAIARIKSPCTPDPFGPSVVRGLGPRTPDASLSERESERPCSSAAPSAGLPPRNAGDPGPPETDGRRDKPADPVASTNVRPEPPPRGRARSVPSPSGPPPDRGRGRSTFAELMAATALAGGWSFDPGDLDSG